MTRSFLALIAFVALSACEAAYGDDYSSRDATFDYSNEY